MSFIPRPFLHKILSFDQRHVQHFAEGVEAGVEITSGHGRMNWSEQDSAATASTVINGVEAEPFTATEGSVITGVEAKPLTEKIGDGDNWSVGEAILAVSAIVVAVVCLLRGAHKAHRQARNWYQKSMKWLCLYLVVWHRISETCNRFYTHYA